MIGGGLGFYAGRLGVAPLERENQRLSGLNRQVAAREVALFFMKTVGTDFMLQPVLTHIPGDSDPHRRALAALFAGPPAGSGLDRVFPKTTKVLGLTIDHGMATVNLNQAATQLNVGAPGEALAVAALVNTLTKFPDVYRVKILVEGNEVESLAGHVDLTQTFGFNDRVVTLDEK